jgi:hypothetical protein
VAPWACSMPQVFWLCRKNAGDISQRCKKACSPMDNAASMSGSQFKRGHDARCVRSPRDIPRYIEGFSHVADLSPDMFVAPLRHFPPCPNWQPRRFRRIAAFCGITGWPCRGATAQPDLQRSCSMGAFYAISAASGTFLVIGKLALSCAPLHLSHVWQRIVTGKRPSGLNGMAIDMES